MRPLIPALAIPVLLLTACGGSAAPPPAETTTATSEAATPFDPNPQTDEPDTSEVEPPEATGTWVRVFAADGQGKHTVLDEDYAKITYDVPLEGTTWVGGAAGVSSVYVTATDPGVTVGCEIWQDGQRITMTGKTIAEDTPPDERNVRCSAQA